MALWLLMSGQYTPLTTSLGVVSAIFATWMSHRIGGSDEEGFPLHLIPRLPIYWVWLLKEIILSNITTAKTILKRNDDPELFRVPITQKTKAGVATYANSITLTPGTVTVEVNKNSFLVHALTTGFGDDIRSGKMDRHVTTLEGDAT
jgi:multicomponent Na+:H+ antiporter subunit E